MEPSLQLKSDLQPRPHVTSSSSPEYCHRLSDISSRACISDPLNILFQREKAGPSATFTLENLYDATLLRIKHKMTLGSTIIEAGNFAAVACWEPPDAVAPHFSTVEIDELAKERPSYSAFLRDLQAAQKECLGEGQKYWQLSLMARDPLKTSKGAVRAIIEPFVVRAREEGVPIWCVAGNVRARDVYAYFGFEVVRVVFSGEEKVRTWCMVCNWPIR